MLTVRGAIVIHAPIERCFDLALNLDLHMASIANETHERAIAGRTSGIIKLGEQVTWEGRHFWVKFHHTSLIDAMTRPTHFRDSMVKGAFASFHHDHYFEHENGATTMRDVIQCAAPLGPLGRIAEVVALRAHILKLIRNRNGMIKRVAESDEWRRYL